MFRPGSDCSPADKTNNETKRRKLRINPEKNRGKRNQAMKQKKNRKGKDGTKNSLLENGEKEKSSQKILRPLQPFSLSLAIILADQIVKALIVHFIPQNTVGFSWHGDFFRLIHVRNPGAAFSLLYDSSGILRLATLIILPLAVLSYIVFLILRDKGIPPSRRWLLAAVLGGGLGNMIDRLFRPAGVVDYLDFKFYGLFGLERWPSFNIADSAIVVTVIIWVLSEFRTKPSEALRDPESS